MLVDFNEVKEVTIPGMNNGTGEMSARMYMDKQGEDHPNRHTQRRLDRPT